MSFVNPEDYFGYSQIMTTLFFLAQQASSSSKIHDHTQTHHTRQVSSGRVISSQQRPLPDNTKHSQETDIHAPGGILTLNSNVGAAVEPRLRPRGHWDRHKCVLQDFVRITLSVGSEQYRTTRIRYTLRLQTEKNLTMKEREHCYL